MYYYTIIVYMRLFHVGEAFFLACRLGTFQFSSTQWLSILFYVIGSLTGQHKKSNSLVFSDILFHVGEAFFLACRLGMFKFSSTQRLSILFYVKCNSTKGPFIDYVSKILRGWMWQNAYMCLYGGWLNTLGWPLLLSFLWLFLCKYLVSRACEHVDVGHVQTKI